MSEPDTLAELTAALAAMPVYADPLQPFYEALAGEPRPLTLAALRQHSQLLRERSGRAQTESQAIQTVIDACQSLPPIPLSQIPLGF